MIIILHCTPAGTSPLLSLLLRCMRKKKKKTGSAAHPSTTPPTLIRDIVHDRTTSNMLEWYVIRRIVQCWTGCRTCCPHHRSTLITEADPARCLRLNGLACPICSFRFLCSKKTVARGKKERTQLKKWSGESADLDRHDPTENFVTRRKTNAVHHVEQNVARSPSNEFCPTALLDKKTLFFFALPHTALTTHNNTAQYKTDTTHTPHTTHDAPQNKRHDTRNSTQLVEARDKTNHKPRETKDDDRSKCKNQKPHIEQVPHKLDCSQKNNDILNSHFVSPCSNFGLYQKDVDTIKKPSNNPRQQQHT